MIVTPQEMSKLVKDYAANIAAATKMGVYVGLPKEKVGGKVYGNGQSVMDIGARHEYGTDTLPRRSFLRVPFANKQKELEAAIATQFRKVIEQGVPAKDALGMVGVKAQQVSQDAFRNRGYGSWKPLAPETIAQKGSSAPLIDTGTLRNSITWVVR